MALLKHGFLGTEGERIHQQILQKYASLFSLLRDFNDICHEVVPGLRLMQSASVILIHTPVHASSRSLTEYVTVIPNVSTKLAKN